MRVAVEVLGFVGSVGRHKLIGPADILGGKYPVEVVELAQRKLEESETPLDAAEALEQADREILLANEKDRLRKKWIKPVAEVSVTSFDPFNVFDIAPDRETLGSVGRPLTIPMIGMLEKAGVKTDKLTFTGAKQIIEEIIRRRESGLCSYKQGRILKQYGYDPDVTFAEAGRIISSIKAHGWRKTG